MSDFITIVQAVYSGLSQRNVAAMHGVIITFRKSRLSPFTEPPVSCFRATDIRLQSHPFSRLF